MARKSFIAFFYFFLFAIGLYAEDLQKKTSLNSAAKLAEQIILENQQKSFATPKVEKNSEISIRSTVGIFSRLGYGFEQKAFTRRIEKMINSLSYPEDPLEYTLRLSISPLPWSGINHIRFVDDIKYKRAEAVELELNLGVLGLVENEAELAAVIAHHLALRNPQAHKFLDDQKTSEWVENILSGFSSADEFTGNLKRKIQADIGAVDRLIRAGYNPWGAYTLLRKISDWTIAVEKGRVSMAQWAENIWGSKFFALTQQPLPDLRMNIIKQFINHLEFKRDLADLQEAENLFPDSVKYTRLRAKALAGPLLYGRAQKAVVIGAVGIGALIALKHFWPQATEALSDQFLSIGDFFGRNRATFFSYGANGISILGGSYIAYKVIKNFQRYKLFLTANALLVKKRSVAVVKDLWSIFVEIPSATVSLTKSIGKLFVEVFGVFKKVSDHIGRFLTKKRTFPFASISLWLSESVQNIFAKPIKVLSELLQTYHRVNELQSSRSSKLKENLTEAIASLSSSLMYLSQLDTRVISVQKLHENFELKRALKALDKIDYYFKTSKLRHRSLIWASMADVIRDWHEMFLVEPSLRERLLSLWKNYGQASDRDLVFKVYFLYGFSERRKYGLKTLIDSPDGKEVQQNLRALTAMMQLFDWARIFKSLEPWKKTHFLLILNSKLSSEKHRLSEFITKSLTSDVFTELLEAATSPIQPQIELYKMLPESNEYIDIERINFRLGDIISLLPKSTIRDESIVFARFLYSKNYPFRPLDGKIEEFIYDAIKSIKDDFSKLAILLLLRNNAYGDSFSSFDKKSFERFLAYDKKISKWFISYVDKNIHSISELLAFCENKILPYGVKLKYLTPELYELILHNPQWFKTKEDIEALTRAEYFWPERGASKKATSKTESILLKTLEDQSRRFPDYWRFEPAAAEVLHLRIIQIAKQNKIYEASWEDQFEFWKTLSERGVTSTTDALFEKLFENATPAQKDLLELEGLKGRIWDQPLKVAIVRRQVLASSTLKLLIESKDKPLNLARINREIHLAHLLDDIRKKLPEGGLGYVRLLEDVSIWINSHPHEAKIIQEAKVGKITGDNKAQDSVVFAVSQMMDRALEWKKKQQWDFILFLRGDIEATPFIQGEFASVGTERVRRIFQLLPLEARASIIEAFLSSSRGLIPKVDPQKGFARVIIDKILERNTPEAQTIGRQVLEAFLISMKGGRENMRSFVLSYLLSMLKSNEEASLGRVLRTVFEVFGAMGVKIGQILAVTEVLDPKDAEELFLLQDRAKVPDRHKIYQELKELLGRDMLPYRIFDLKGAASLKYAVHGKDEETNEEFVLKILREEAPIHTTAEFRQLERMADYLVENYGSKFGLLRAIIKAAKQAVDRELQLDREVKMSQIADSYIYTQKKVGDVNILVPEELNLAPRIMASHLASGTSINELPPKEKALMAETIWKIEGDNIFRPDQGKDIWFDPDRHAGNYRIDISNTPTLAPIDFGQVMSLTEKQRSQIFDLFGLAQILKRSGATEWAVNKIIKILEIKEPDQKLLGSVLKKYFNGNQKLASEVSSYYNLLAVLEDSKMGQEIVFFDFIRGIIQLSQYKKFLSEPMPHLDPRQRLSVEVKKRLDPMLEEMKLEIAKTDGLKGRVIQGVIAPELSKGSHFLAKCARALRLVSDDISQP